MSARDDAVAHARRLWADSAETDVAIPDAPTRSLAELLSVDELALIVEPKRATAARGAFNEGLDVARVAAECEQHGAGAMSIVTEAVLSGGSIDDLRAARAACQLPVLARDLVVSRRQLHTLRAAGADAVYVPAWLFTEVDEDDAEALRLDELVSAAHSLGMEVVLGVADEAELDAALDSDVDVLAIDNRDDSGSVDVERTFDLLAAIPVGWPVISESIADLEQVAQLQRAGVDALLLDEGHVDGGLATALSIYVERSLDA